MREIRFLVDPDTGERYSANASDYWKLEPDYIFRNKQGKNLWLIADGMIKKKIVRKKDLLDEIYEEQRSQASIVKLRKSLGRDKLFILVVRKWDTYILDGKGRIARLKDFLKRGRKAFSDMWVLEGVADILGKKLLSWDEALKNPKLARGKYVIDLDSGTKRIWSKKITRIFLDKTLRENRRR